MKGIRAGSLLRIVLILPLAFAVGGDVINEIPEVHDPLDPLLEPHQPVDIQGVAHQHRDPPRYFLLDWTGIVDGIEQLLRLADTTAEIAPRIGGPQPQASQQQKCRVPQPHQGNDRQNVQRRQHDPAGVGGDVLEPQALDVCPWRTPARGPGLAVAHPPTSGWSYRRPVPPVLRQASLPRGPADGASAACLLPHLGRPAGAASLRTPDGFRPGGFPRVWPVHDPRRASRPAAPGHSGSPSGTCPRECPVFAVAHRVARGRR